MKGGIRTPIKAPISTKRDYVFTLSMLDVAILLANVHKGVESAEVGYEDYERPLRWLVSELSKRRLKVSKDALERALWSCVQLEEHEPLTGGFWSPKGETVSEFVSRITEDCKLTHKLKFDKDYCFFKELKG